MSRETVAWRRGHLDWAANILAVQHDAFTQIEHAEDAEIRATIVNDASGEEVMNLTLYGMRLMIFALRAHRCGPACDRMYGVCPMITIAWLIEGCPGPGDDLRETAMRGYRKAESEAEE